MKKPGLLRGIGHMFRFGKHRKDGIVPTEMSSDISKNQTQMPAPSQLTAKENVANSGISSSSNNKNTIGRSGPPIYQPPPPVAVGIPVGNGIHQNDVFNHRYSHYVNYEELQQQIRYDQSILNLTQ